MPTQQASGIALWMHIYLGLDSAYAERGVSGQQSIQGKLDVLIGDEGNQWAAVE